MSPRPRRSLRAGPAGSRPERVISGRRREIKAADSIVSRVDHVMIRTEDPRSLLTLMTGSLGLPVGQQPTTYPGPFTNATVGAGNTVLELIRFGPLPETPPANTDARLWGIAFEPAAPLSEVQKNLDSRKIPRLAQQVFERPEPGGEPRRMWTNLSVSMLEHTRRARAFFFIGRLLSSLFGRIQRRRMRRMAEAADPNEVAQWMDEERIDSMNDVVGHGWVFFTEYDPDFLDPEQARAEGQKAFREHGEGPLGIEAVEEILVGATDLATARERWRQLFAPTPEVEPGLWKAGDGPAIRVVPHAENRILSLVLKVASLEKARSSLAERDMLESSRRGETKISPTPVGGLSIKLRD